MVNTEMTVPGDAALIARAVSYAKTSKSTNTCRAYAADLSAFVAWAESHGKTAVPASVEFLACYVAHLADSGKKSSTISRALSGINAAHRAAGFDVPRGRVLDETLQGVRRQIGTSTAGKAPVMADHLRRMVEATPSVRDRAILIVGWVGAFRRSEIVGLNVRDLHFTRNGLEVTVRRSKTDQFGQGRIVGLPNSLDAMVCPVRAVQAWLAESRATDGQLFPVCDRMVARIVKRAAAAAGLASDEFSGHSLRAGFSTEAAAQGRSLKSMMNQTGHRSERIAMKYIRHDSVWADNAARGLL